MRFPQRWIVLLVLASLVAPAAPGVSLAAPITFNTALPVAQSEGIVRVQGRFLRASDDPTPMNRDLRVLAFPLVGVFGVTESLAGFAVVPFLRKEMKITSGGGRVSRSDAGVGDVRMFLRYTIYQRDSKGETLRLAPFAGAEFPTGDHNQADALGPLPRPLQLGSGSWDPFVGLVGSWQRLSGEVDAQVAWQANTEADGFEFSDAITFDASYQYRLWPRELGGGVPGFLYAVLESNLLWRQKNQVFGIQDPDSGGTTWSLTPGLQYVTRRLVIEAAVQIPVVQALGGTALEMDFQTIFSIRGNF